MLSKLLTAPEVAQLLAVSDDRVYELARLKLIPVVRVGRQVRFEPSQLRRWIEQGGQGLG